MYKNIAIGTINLMVAVLLTVVFALLISFHIKNYQQQISYYYNSSFFTFDPFATELLGIILATLVINYIASALIFSGMLKPRTNSEITVFSLSSILWILLYIAGSFSAEVKLITIVPIILLIGLMIVFRQIQHPVTLVALVVSTVFVGLLAIF